VGNVEGWWGVKRRKPLRGGSYYAYEQSEIEMREMEVAEGNGLNLVDIKPSVTGELAQGSGEQSVRGRG